MSPNSWWREPFLASDSNASNLAAVLRGGGFLLCSKMPPAFLLGGVWVFCNALSRKKGAAPAWISKHRRLERSMKRSRSPAPSARQPFRKNKARSSTFHRLALPGCVEQRRNSVRTKSPGGLFSRGGVARRLSLACGPRPLLRPPE
jgi:hypothetical protein